jgi:signal transduction histidine kinase
LPHFNWRKAGLRDFEEGTVEEILDIKAIEKGVRGENAKSWVERIAFAYAVSLATGHRAVFCFGSRVDGSALSGEADFLQRLALRICQPYLERRQFIELKSREDKWEFATSLLGHQVRGSLQPIRSETDIVRHRIVRKEAWVSEERTVKALDVIEAECEVLAKSATDALDFFWMVGQNRGKFVRQSLAGAVLSCVEGFKGLAKRENLEIRVDPSVNQLPDVELIGRTMEIAIRNMLENAIKYSFDERVIEVRSRVEDGFVILEIDNYGIGIPEEEREKVFEKGYRGLDRGRKTIRQGEGLGAWQAREILRAHGGEIECVSRSGERQPVSGHVHGFRTIFTLSLPIEQAID